MHLLDQFRSFNADMLDIDELVALALFGRQLRSEYETLQIEEPDWVDIQLKSLRREIHAKNADMLEARRREINVRLDSLKSADERRKDLIEERERIDAKLGKVSA